MAWIERKGRQLYYFSAGDGPPVVLLHGITNSGRAWAQQVPALAAAGYRVIIPDLAGHGASGRVDRRYGIDDLVDDLMALTTRLSSRPHLAGISLGGMIALAAALAHPDAFDRLVIADSFASTTGSEFEQLADRWAALLRETDGPSKLLAEAWPQMLDDAFRASAEGQRTCQVWQGVAAASHGPSIANVIAGIVGFDVGDRLGEVPHKVLLITGEDDEMSPPDVSRAMADALPDARLVTLSSAKHLSNVDAADRFTREMLGHLK